LFTLSLKGPRRALVGAQYIVPFPDIRFLSFLALVPADGALSVIFRLPVAQALLFTLREEGSPDGFTLSLEGPVLLRSHVMYVGRPKPDHP